MAPEALNQRSSKANQKNLLHGVCHTSQERKRDKLSQPNTVGLAVHFHRNLSSASVEA
jgi:hypothetical protein